MGDVGVVTVVSREGPVIESYGDRATITAGRRVAQQSSDVPSSPPQLRYTSEWVKRTRYFPAGWDAPSFDEQRALTEALYPGLVLPEINSRIAVPKGWVPWYFPPRLDALGRLLGLGVDHCYDDAYELLVRHQLNLVAQGRKSNDLCASIRPGGVRMHPEVCGWIKRLESKYDGDFLPPMAVELGRCYGGMSTRGARERALYLFDLPLCTVHVGALLAIMPGRLQFYFNLFLDAAGDQYNDCPTNDSTLCDCCPNDEQRGNCEHYHNWRGSLRFFITNTGALDVDIDDARIPSSIYGAVVGQPEII